MGSDPRLMALPALRKLAEEEARDLFVARYTDAARGHRDWAEGDNERELCIRAHLSLLSDLSRPASRDAVARLVAEHIGWDAFDVTRAVESSTAMLAGLYRAAGLPELPRWEPAPTPAEALTLIALAVLGGAS